ncbi:hypothetical protein [Sulfitobacter guttiformis]|uniref:Uncharacterized protein n=1 Tax=Sulfitobacter guttiformis TaxID=74349 RepID=A0A420DHC2_9RHOB|nr:hypothetical protein [Sulfitobacter guttiformis]KIN72646.1 hypothetical protein Z949_1824 [Sulfitobacter guttiformis KCTC 32187]RKE93624.1 hypothetical protein C8N30_2701 [Sulfitobacter guttiformis]
MNFTTEDFKISNKAMTFDMADYFVAREQREEFKSDRSIAERKREEQIAGRKEHIGRAIECFKIGDLDGCKEMCILSGGDQDEFTGLMIDIAASLSASGSDGAQKGLSDTLMTMMKCYMKAISSADSRWEDFNIVDEAFGFLACSYLEKNEPIG